MSRIGKHPIQIPSGVEVAIDGPIIKVSGKRGELTRSFPASVNIEVSGDELVITPDDNLQQTRAYWGLARSILHNMVVGVDEGFEKNLELVGVGYRAALRGHDLELQVGYSNPILIKAPEGITFECPSQTQIKVSGISKEQVGQVAANIRSVRSPEPYKGKGIRYAGEYIKRKAGKAGKE